MLNIIYTESREREGKNKSEKGSNSVDMHIRLVSIIKHISQTFGVFHFWNGVDAAAAAASAVAVALTVLCGKICFVVASMQLFSVNAPKI